MTDDVILYRLPEQAETELKLLIAEGAQGDEAGHPRTNHRGHDLMSDRDF